VIPLGLLFILVFSPSRLVAGRPRWPSPASSPASPPPVSTVRGRLHPHAAVALSRPLADRRLKSTHAESTVQSNGPPRALMTFFQKNP
jgi:hypothetical protein